MKVICGGAAGTKWHARLDQFHYTKPLFLCNILCYARLDVFNCTKPYQALVCVHCTMSNVINLCSSHYPLPFLFFSSTLEMGLTGVPVFNVNNNCSSGSTALMLARSLVQSGLDCVLAVGNYMWARKLCGGLYLSDTSFPILNSQLLVIIPNYVYIGCF